MELKYAENAIIVTNSNVFVSNRSSVLAEHCRCTGIYLVSERDHDAA